MKPAHLTGMVVGLSNRRSERGVLTAFTRAGLRVKVDGEEDREKIRIPGLICQVPFTFKSMSSMGCQW